MPLNDVPQSGQTLANTQAPIRNNFSVIGTAFITDHVDYNAAGQGKHNKVTFPVQSPAPAFAAGELGLYNALFNTGTAPTNVNELFVKKAAGIGYPMTASLNNANGYTYLPSGILLQWGAQTLMNFSVTFPRPFTAIYAVYLTINDPAGASNTAVVKTTLLTGFTGQSTFNGTKFWFAVGVG